MSDYSLVPGRRCAVGPPGGYKEPEHAPVRTYKMSPEEIAKKYGNPRTITKNKISPLAVLTDPVMQKTKLYIAYRDLNRQWTNDEVQTTIRLWNNGASVIQIADALGRDPDEVILLLISLAREDKIQQRWVGTQGNGCATPEM